MTTKDIYERYDVPPNLQKHMLRVAALSQILVENWQQEKLDKDAITLGGLFHDMANIIKFDLNKPQLFKEEEKRIDYWRQVQRKYIKKYGNNIHKVTCYIKQGLFGKI